MTLLEDAAFWVSIATLLIMAYRFSISQAYRSKCSDFQLCWGVLSIQRNVEVEAKIDEMAMHTDHVETQDA